MLFFVLFKRLSPTAAAATSLVMLDKGSALWCVYFSVVLCLFCLISTVCITEGGKCYLNK